MSKPNVAIDLSELNSDVQQNTSASGEESKGPFEKNLEVEKEKKQELIQVNLGLSDHDSDDDIVPGEGD